jgi:hypothetical protein
LVSHVGLRVLAELLSHGMQGGDQAEVVQDPWTKSAHDPPHLVQTQPSGVADQDELLSGLG